MKKASLILMGMMVISSVVFAQDIKYPNRGYRGFAETSLGSGSIDEISFFEFGINTIHGYQIIPQLFVGGGIGANVYGLDFASDNNFEDYNNTEWDVIPVFLNIRGDFIKKKVSPFADIRIGTSVGDIEGDYFALSAGIRLKRVNLSLSYVSQEGYNYTQHVNRTNIVKTGSIDSILLNVSIDWGARY
ncbi:MAG: hypothetical protein J5651_07470 [Salinivirgaceae bacterium]|nr:hypothetical protein [Salinivirgaceae bacterium]